LLKKIHKVCIVTWQPNHPFVPRSAHDRCSRTSPQLLRSLCGSVDVREEKRMSFVPKQPKALTAAADTVQGIGSSMSAQNAATVARVPGVVPAAADEVSAMIAPQFANYAEMLQAVSAQAAAIHETFVNTVNTFGISARSDAATEAANSTGPDDLAG
jgi:hypothetical protein